MKKNLCGKSRRQKLVKEIIGALFFIFIKRKLHYVYIIVRVCVRVCVSIRISEVKQRHRTCYLKIPHRDQTQLLPAYLPCFKSVAVPSSFVYVL